MTAIIYTLSGLVGVAVLYIAFKLGVRGNVKRESKVTVFNRIESMEAKLSDLALIRSGIEGFAQRFDQCYQNFYPIWVKSETDIWQAIEVTRSNVNDLVKICDTRAGAILSSISLSRDTLNVIGKQTHEDAMYLHSENKADVVEQKEIDQRLPNAITGLTEAAGKMADEMANIRSLTSGLESIAKSLAEVAFKLEKSAQNPYERYAGKDRNGDEMDEILRLSKDFGMSIEDATQAVSSKVRRK